MTLKSALNVMAEAEYIVTIHWHDGNRDWYESIIMDYLNSTNNDRFVENLRTRKRAEALPNKVSYIRYNKAYEMNEITVDVWKGGAKRVNRKRAS